MDTNFVEMIESSLDSVWSLELLLLLHSDPERCWNRADLVAELRSSNLVVAQSVGALKAGGLAIECDDGTVKYGPSSNHVSAFVDQLEREYRARPTSVRRLIVGRSNSKLQSFSDAFVLRKPQK